MRARVWRDHGVASLAIDDITDPWLRQAIINEANRRWGLLANVLAELNP